MLALLKMWVKSKFTKILSSEDNSNRKVPNEIAESKQHVYDLLALIFQYSTKFLLTRSTKENKMN